MSSSVLQTRMSCVSFGLQLSRIKLFVIWRPWSIFIYPTRCKQSIDFCWWSENIRVVEVDFLNRILHWTSLIKFQGERKKKARSLTNTHESKEMACAVVVCFNSCLFYLILIMNSVFYSHSVFFQHTFWFGIYDTLFHVRSSAVLLFSSQIHVVVFVKYQRWCLFFLVLWYLSFIFYTDKILFCFIVVVILFCSDVLSLVQLFFVAH